MEIKVTYKYRLYPTKEEEWNFNWTLAQNCSLNKTFLKEIIVAYKKKQKQPTKFQQINSLKEIKEQNPKLKQIFSQVLQNVPKQRVLLLRIISKRGEKKTQKQDYLILNFLIATTLSPILNMDLRLKKVN